MTAIVVAMWPNAAKILTDTVTTGGDGMPAGLCVKAFPLAHLRMVMTHTGLVDVGDTWLTTVNCWAGLDIVEIDQVAPRLLRGIWRKGKKFGRPHRPGSSRILHFGFATGETRLRAFQYSSEDGFESKPVTAEGVLVIPGVEFHEDVFDPPDDLLIRIIERQRQSTHDDEKPLVIGGEVQLIVLTPDAIQVRIAHRFANYPEILAGLRKRDEERAALRTEIAKLGAVRKFLLRCVGVPTSED